MTKATILKKPMHHVSLYLVSYKMKQSIHQHKKIWKHVKLMKVSLGNEQGNYKLFLNSNTKIHGMLLIVKNERKKKLFVICNISTYASLRS